MICFLLPDLVAPPSCRLSRGRLALGCRGEDNGATAAETAALQIFLRPLIKWRRHDLRSNTLSANLDLQCCAHRGQPRWHVSQCDILLQERSRRPAGDVSNLAAPGIQHLISITRDAAFSHLQTYQGPSHARGLRFLQCTAADELRLLHLAEAVEPSFPHIDRIGNLM